MKITQQFLRQYRLQQLLFIALFLCVIATIAWLSTQYTLQSDWTAGNRNSLNDDTIALLDNISDPISIRSYLANDVNMKQAVTEILNRYQLHKQNLSFEILNLDLDIEQSKIDGISNYGQTVISYNNRQEVISTLSEQNIGNALLRLSRENKPVLFFLQGHGERKPVDTSPIGYSNLSTQLQTNGFALHSLNLLTDTILAADGTLIIADASKKILPGEMQQIKDFLQQGGNLLWLQDPGISEDFNSISEFLNIEFINGVVVDTDPQLRKVLQLSHPAKLPVINYKMHAITEKMQNFTLFVTAAAIKVNTAPNWQASTLLMTTDTSWAETEGFILDVKYDSDKGDVRGPLSIGVALQRTLLEQANKTQRIVVIGDSDFMSNNNIGHGANIDFILNAINWLSKDEQLISIRSKTAPDIKLELSDTAIAVIGFGFLLVIPGLLILTGVFIWLKRRNQ